MPETVTILVLSYSQAGTLGLPTHESEPIAASIMTERFVFALPVVSGGELRAGFSTDRPNDNGSMELMMANGQSRGGEAAW